MKNYHPTDQHTNNIKVNKFHLGHPIPHLNLNNNKKIKK